MESVSIRYQTLIKDDQLAQALQKSGVYEAGKEGVSYTHNDTTYTITARYQSAAVQRPEQLDVEVWKVRALVTWISLTPYLGATFQHQSSSYWNYEQSRQASANTFKATVISASNSILFYRQLEHSFGKNIAEDCIRLGLTEGRQGVNIRCNGVLWNISFHSDNSKKPFICLKSADTLLIQQNKTSTQYSGSGDVSLSEILRNAQQDNTSQNVSLPKISQAVKNALEKKYPTVLKPPPPAPNPQIRKKQDSTHPLTSQKQSKLPQPQKEQNSKGGWNTTAWILGGLALLALLGIGYSYRQSFFGRPQNV